MRKSVQLSILLAALQAGTLCLGQAPAGSIAAHPPFPAFAPGQQDGRTVEYTSDGLKLKGVLYLPDGKGPFPAIVWNHEANKIPKEEPELALFYTRRGFAFFEPMRRGHAGNPGKTVDELLAPALAQNIGNPGLDRKFVQLMQSAGDDVAAAVTWLESDHDIDGSQVFMSGISYGGIECLLSADTLPGIRGYVVFSGGARLFSNQFLQARLIRTVKDSKAPILLIQAENDYTIDPVRVLGPLLQARGDGSVARLYPAFGSKGDIGMGHVAFATWNLGTRTWGNDVLQFLKSAAGTNR